MENSSSEQLHQAAAGKDILPTTPRYLYAIAHYLGFAYLKSMDIKYDKISFHFSNLFRRNLTYQILATVNLAVSINQRDINVSV